MLIETLRQQVGAEQVSQYMYDLGVRLSAGLIPRLVEKTAPSGSMRLSGS